MVITIDVPKGSKLLIKENQKVEIGEPYLESKTESVVAVPIAKRLEIDPTKIFHYLKKLVGEEIKKGEVIASKKGFLTNLVVKSEYDGIIKEINHENGEVIITTYKDKKKTVSSYFKGKVKKIEDGEIKLEVEQADDFRLATSSDNFGGETYYLEDSRLDFTSGDIEEKIVIAEKISTFAWTKSEALGAKGFITLTKIEDQEETKCAQLKNIADIEKIMKQKFPYCLIDRKNSKIILYK